MRRFVLRSVRHSHRDLNGPHLCAHVPSAGGRRLRPPPRPPTPGPTPTRKPQRPEPSTPPGSTSERQAHRSRNQDREVGEAADGVHVVEHMGALALDGHCQVFGLGAFKGFEQFG
jgi:hypothetical protein